MKTSQQIIGLPVVSISDGNEIGKVKNVIINAVKGTVDFFVIDSGIRSLAGGVIPVAKVLGIGEYALTIMEPDDISDIVKLPAAIDLLQKNITVRGTRVLTKRGSLLGETGDLMLEENEDCRIIGVEFVPTEGHSSGIIPKDCIITFGKNLLVVDNDFLEKLIESPLSAEAGDGKKLIPAAETAPALPAIVEPDDFVNAVPVVTEPDVGDEALSLDRFVSDIDFAQSADVVPESEAVKVDDPEAEAATTNLFEERQKQFLRGRRVTKTIKNSDGQVIVSAGEIITNDMIDAIKTAGKLVELVMNNET